MTASIETGSQPTLAEEAGALAILLVGLSLLPAAVFWMSWSEVRQLKAQWTIAGPPCTVVDQPAQWAVSRRKPRYTHRYGEAVFTRSFGAVSCAALPEGPPWRREHARVCQFNNPGAVTVVTAEGNVTFQPPVGRRATVTVRRGEATCVVGGWFNY